MSSMFLILLGTVNFANKKKYMKLPVTGCSDPVFWSFILFA